MLPIHGKSISSEEVERIVSRMFSPRLFASLCNSLSWASAGRRCSSLPSFTERVNVRDGGIDVEWETELPDDGEYASPLLGPGWNVFQYKQRDILARNRNEIFSSLKSGVKSAISELHDKTGRRPDRYVLFANLDLTHFTNGQKGQLKEEILEGYDQHERPHLEIVGAAELATFLNDLPHLRSGFFVPMKFSTWECHWNNHNKQKLFGANVELIGREKELTKLQTLIDEPSVRTIVLAGPHNIGKTRLVLEGSGHRSNDTIVALDPRSMSVSDLIALESPGTEVLIIIEGLDLNSAEDFVNQALSCSGMKLLLTLPTAQDAPAPSFGKDERVQTILIGPLSDSDSEKLLKAAKAKFDYGIESWVVAQAGGNPGILLFAASLGEELRKSATDFTENVAKTFEGRIDRELGSNAVEILRLLSLLMHVGIRGEALNELELICSLFGHGIAANTVLNTLPALEDAGVVQTGGSYVEVLPPVFANGLATSALRGRYAELCTLFARLSQGGRRRLIGRLRLLSGDEPARFWDELFGPNGPFADLSSVLTDGYPLRLIASAVPERVLSLIKHYLDKMSLQERLSISGNDRRELMWTIDELLFRKKTSAGALSCLALLAEAETESYGNNATGVFCESFFPYHLQIPLPLQTRLELLKGLFSPEKSTRLRLVGIKAIQSGLTQRAGITVRRSSGAVPLDSPPSMTYGEIWNYLESLFDLLMEQASSDEPDLAKSATEALGDSINEFALHARPEATIDRFENLVTWALTQEVPVPVSRLAEALRFVSKAYEERARQVDQDTASTLRTFAARLNVLRSRLDEGMFSVRLKRWLGAWTFTDDEELEENGEVVSRAEKELRDLAKETLANPELLTDELIDWLCSEEAKKASIFFWWLGKLDYEKNWFPKIEEIGSRDDGVMAFSAYMGGLSQNDRPFVVSKLDELTESVMITAVAIVNATGYLGGDLSGVLRMETIIRQERVDPVYVERVLCVGGWIRTLNGAEFLRLLRAIAGPNLENAVTVVDFFGTWLHNNKPIDEQLAEFAWGCLESARRLTANDNYDFNVLASELAQSDPERGFRLLEMLLSQLPQNECWDPISRYGQNKFWNTLLAIDRERALRIVLSVASEDPLKRFRITWNLLEVIDQERDSDLLVAFAHESEAQAELVCESITSGRPGFWPLALKIIESYPESLEIKAALSHGVSQMGRVVTGSFSAHLENCRKEVEQVLESGAVSTAARSWLEELESSLREWAQKEVISESDREVEID